MDQISEELVGIKFAEEEEKILLYWEQIDAFGTNVKRSEGKPRFICIDGPPFVTGYAYTILVNNFVWI